MDNNNLNLAKGFIKYCKKTKGEIGEVCLEDSVFSLIENALETYGKTVENPSNLCTKDDISGYDKIRKLNFNKLRNLTITPLCARIIYNLYNLGFTINNSHKQIESYNIKVSAEYGHKPQVFRYRLKPVGDSMEFKEIIQSIQCNALNTLDRGLLEVALDMNIPIHLTKSTSLAELARESDWKECESVIIDLGLNDLIVDLNKLESNDSKEVNVF